MKSIKTSSYPPEVEKISILLGERLKAARIRRGLRQHDLARRAGVSRSTIQALERGELTCAAGALFTVLWTLGLSKELDLIADPGLDREGLTLALDASNKRVYVPRSINNDF